MLQDALFARESWLKQPGNEDVATRFLRASFQGWIYCRANPDDCIQYTVNAGSKLGAGHQRWMMNEINPLVWPSPNGIGIMDPALGSRPSTSRSRRASSRPRRREAPTGPTSRRRPSNASPMTPRAPTSRRARPGDPGRRLRRGFSQSRRAGPRGPALRFRAGNTTATPDRGRGRPAELHVGARSRGSARPLERPAAPGYRVHPTRTSVFHLRRTTRLMHRGRLGGPLTA